MRIYVNLQETAFLPVKGFTSLMNLLTLLIIETGHKIRIRQFKKNNKIGGFHALPATAMRLEYTSAAGRSLLFRPSSDTINDTERQH